MSDKTQFITNATFLVDTRERQCDHIISGFASLGVKHERRKLDIGDVSFVMPDRDFSLSWVVERKAGADELYNNIMERVAPGRMNRLEKELDAGCRTVKQLILLIESVASWEALKDYTVPDWQMEMSPQRKASEIGKPCYNRLRAWQTANRYDFGVEFVADRANTATRIVELAYYYWHNYKALIAPRR